MTDSYLGIDVGTSSLKIMNYSENGIEIAKAEYTESFPSGIITALAEALTKINTENVCAISISSQVGTYIVNDEKVLFWNENIGREELDYILKEIPKEEYIREISMSHPELISYPIPRLLYIKKHFKDAHKVCMPKDYLIQYLTGNFVSDNYSYRGIVNQTTGKYSEKILQKFCLEYELPQIKGCFDLVGTVKNDVAKILGLKNGVAVYNGLNDFYAGLLGMGVLNTGDAFELSGTSEHIGIVSERLVDNGSISGPYLNGFATYGGTASGGTSCKFAIENFGIDGLDLKTELDNNPPIFLPYLNGERAPIFDENAKGVFFGISGKTTKQDMAYSVLEGVCFSLYDIYKSMGEPSFSKLISAGGSARNKLMTELKAELFETEIINTELNDVSALGACIVACVGNGKYNSVNGAVLKMVKYEKPVSPKGDYRDKLLNRYGIYKSLYADLKKEFKNFKEIL